MIQKQLAKIDSYFSEKIGLLIRSVIQWRSSGLSENVTHGVGGIGLSRAVRRTSKVARCHFHSHCLPPDI